jgi:hypothetical protein
MSISNILRPKTSDQVTPYDLVVHSIETDELAYSSGRILLSLNGAGTAILQNTVTDVVFNSIDDADSHTSYNLSTGVFTVGKSGNYTIVFNEVFDASGSAGVATGFIEFTEAGPSVRNLAYVTSPIVVGAAATGLVVVHSRFLVAGTTFKFRVEQSAVASLLLLGNSQAFPISCSVLRESYTSSD